MKLQTQNFDVCSLVTRMDRFIKEAIKSQSANTAGIIIHDVNRLKSYLLDCVTLKAHFEAQPILDLPEVHPLTMELTLTDLAEIEKIENDALKDWARLMYAAAKELADSQSSRQATNFVSHDSRRIGDIYTKLENYIKNYVETVLPQDLPETIPSFASVTPGQTGI